MTSAAGTVEENHRVRRQDEDEEYAAISEKKVGSEGQCIIGKHGGRRRRRKWPPDGSDRLKGFNETSTSAATDVAFIIPEIYVSEEKDNHQVQEEDLTRESSGSVGGGIDEGIYDWNSSSINSSIGSNKSSSSDGRCSKSSQDVANSSWQKLTTRRSSYCLSGDAISLMITEGCELCQGSVPTNLHFMIANYTYTIFLPAAKQRRYGGSGFLLSFFRSAI